MKPSVLLKKIHDYLTDKDYRIIFNSHRGFYNKMNDKEYLELMYRTLMHKELNLDNPQTFTEKLQWLKLYNRHPEYTTMVDKYESKKYVANSIGENYVVPTFGVWNHFDDIDFNKLPNQFVLKCTHDSSGPIICKDKNEFDKSYAKKKLESNLRHNYFYRYREWPYKNVKPKIIAEELLTDGNNNITDYKFFCFNGKCKFLYIMQEMSNLPTQVILDSNFNRLEFKMEDTPAKNMPQKPDCFEKMIACAEALSKNIPFLRVDMYMVKGKIYIGEFTFYHSAGFIPFNPPEWDLKLGQLITLPRKKNR